MPPLGDPRDDDALPLLGDDEAREVEKTEDRAPEVGEKWQIWYPDVEERDMAETTAVNGINKDNAVVFQMDVCTAVEVNSGDGDVADTYEVKFDELGDPDTNDVVSRLRCFALSPF